MFAPATAACPFCGPEMLKVGMTISDGKGPAAADYQCRECQALVHVQWPRYQVDREYRMRSGSLVPVEETEEIDDFPAGPI